MIWFGIFCVRWKNENGEVNVRVEDAVSAGLGAPSPKRPPGGAVIGKG